MKPIAGACRETFTDEKACNAGKDDKGSECEWDKDDNKCGDKLTPAAAVAAAEAIATKAPTTAAGAAVAMGRYKKQVITVTRGKATR